MDNLTFPFRACIWLALATSAQTALAANYFSLDIGSDTEISDPFGGAGENADPGDVYQSRSVAGSLLSTAPALDDAALFGGLDPWPVQVVPATAAPIGTAGLSTSYFDMDGYDALDYRLSQFDLSPDAPLAIPINRTDAPLNCVHEARYLTLSFNDDSIAGWGAAAAPRVPTEGASPVGRFWGTTAAQNELVGVEINPSLGLPAAILGIGGVADEITVHADIGPNPAIGAPANDDDVDALDSHPEVSACQVHYFSADSEARMGLVPGNIYMFAGGAAPSVAVRPLHLGLPQSVNIDAFEFVWLPAPNGQGKALALLFSVQPDNPASAVDESGGLIPSTIYGSFLTGVSFIVVDGPANNFDDVDAITIRPADIDTDEDGVPDDVDNCLLVPNPAQVDANGDGIGNYCDADINANCLVDFGDLAIFRTVFFTNNAEADFNVDGSVNFADLVILKNSFLSAPGPAAEPNICAP